jgi:hypothetical protein
MESAEVEKRSALTIAITVAPGFIRTFPAAKTAAELIGLIGPGRILSGGSPVPLDSPLAPGSYAFAPDDAGRVAEARRIAHAIPTAPWPHVTVRFGTWEIPVDPSLALGELDSVVREEFRVLPGTALLSDVRRDGKGPGATLAECGSGPGSVVNIAESAPAVASVAVPEERIRVRFRIGGTKVRRGSFPWKGTARDLVAQLRAGGVIDRTAKYRVSVRGYEMTEDDPISDIKGSVAFVNEDASK